MQLRNQEKMSQVAALAITKASNQLIREKAFREMKKDVGMTTAQKVRKQEGWQWDQSLFCISSQQSLHIRTLLHYNLKLPDVYVGIVGWIYRTKIDPISILIVSLLF